MVTLFSRFLLYWCIMRYLNLISHFLDVRYYYYYYYYYYYKYRDQRYRMYLCVLYCSLVMYGSYC